MWKASQASAQALSTSIGQANAKAGSIASPVAGLTARKDRSRPCTRCAPIRMSPVIISIPLKRFSSAQARAMSLLLRVPHLECGRLIGTAACRTPRANSSTCRRAADRCTPYCFDRDGTSCRPPSSTLEPGRERFRTSRQQAGIRAHRRDQRAELDRAARETFVPGQDARNAAAGLDAPDRLLDHPLHLRMTLVADMAEVGRQVARTDEEAVDPLDAGDCLEVF